jgi:hypothetical protein
VQYIIKFSVHLNQAEDGKSEDHHHAVCLTTGPRPFSIGVTWLIIYGGGCKKDGEDRFEQVRNMHTYTPFPHSYPSVLFAPLQFNSQKDFLGRKNIGRTFDPPSK